MKRTFLLSSIFGATVLLLAGGAGATAGPFGALQRSAQSSPSQITLARHGGGMMGMHMHSGAIAGPHISHGPVLHAFSSPHVHHLHHHHHRRFFFVGVPYYDYSYDDCYWSRRYHRWICPYY